MNLDTDFDFSEDAFGFEFDDEGLDFETRYIKPPKVKGANESNLKYSDAQKLANDIEIQAGSRHFVVVNGSFYFGDFIEALIVEKGFKVKELTVSTLSMNENNIDSFAGLLKTGFVKQLNLIVSDYFFSHERKNLVEYLYKEVDSEANNFSFAAAGSHCKIVLIETECGKKIVMHGSANLRSSNNIEQVMIEENGALYDFNYEYQKNILTTFATINKSVRYSNLWDAVKGTN